MTVLKDSEIVILYIEDLTPLLESYIKLIKRRWNTASEGVRSLERARDLVAGGFRPHFAIHDCQPLEYEDDEIPLVEAGNELYAFLVRERIPVVVISGHGSEQMEQMPYRSDPPLGFLEKPLEEEVFERAVEIYRRSEAERR